ncbi:hypothetical protein SDC9_137793 [bioreactor metagenome]|uniref:Uncharacterized protein n=1 Tax=bioreactor metagenome TaxID=1076179 RepID=A0A645DN27_9ZZZZ
MIRHPAVDQRDRNAAPPGFDHHVRPDFSFKNHQHRRLEDGQRPADHPEKVDRAENHRRVFRRLAADQLLPGRGRGRKNEFPLRMLLPPGAQQRQRHHRLAHAHRVNPDRAVKRLQLLHPVGRETAEALRERPLPARPVPVLEVKPRRVEQEAHRHEQIVDQTEHFIPP